MEVIGIRPVSKSRVPLVRISDGHMALNELTAPDASPYMARAAKFISDMANKLTLEPYTKGQAFTLADQPTVPQDEQRKIKALVEQISIDVNTGGTLTRFTIKVTLGTYMPVYSLAPIPAHS